MTLTILSVLLIAGCCTDECGYSYHGPTGDGNIQLVKKGKVKVLAPSSAEYAAVRKEVERLVATTYDFYRMVPGWRRLASQGDEERAVVVNYKAPVSMAVPAWEVNLEVTGIYIPIGGSLLPSRVVFVFSADSPSPSSLIVRGSKEPLLKLLEALMD